MVMSFKFEFFLGKKHITIKKQYSFSQIPVFQRLSKYEIMLQDCCFGYGNTLVSLRTVQLSPFCLTSFKTSGFSILAKTSGFWC